MSGMRALTVNQILDVWENAIRLTSPRRAVALLGAACPELSADELLALPLGVLNQLLLRLREHLFGPTLKIDASCPACRERLESMLRVSDLQATPAPQVPPHCTVLLGGREIAFRPPSAGDLIGLPDDPAEADRALLSRCLIGTDAAAARDAAATALSADDIAAIGEAMAAADPFATADIGMVCEACGNRWDCPFDIASFLWREIDAWAQRTLREVHALARAYAWSEADILAMSATRRQIYLDWSRA